MASYLKSLNPTPGFPEYTGPYSVGTFDVEVPVQELDAGCEKPEEAKGIETVLFRVWYPCVREGEKGKELKKGIPWLPNPQREYIEAYSRFLGAGKRAASIIS
jgi:platelet-activating factor acetylhydrolase